MKDSARSNRFRTVAGITFSVVLLGGCASQTSAPVRHGSTPPTPVAASPAGPGQAQAVHVVRPGDTLMGISRLYGQNFADLVAWNTLIDPNQLRVGQEVRVSPPPVAGGDPGPVAVAQPVQIHPVSPAGGMIDAPVKHEPRGGRQPYSDQAWAAISPPASTIVGSPPQQPAVPTGGKWSWPVTGGEILVGFDQPKDQEGKVLNKGIDIGGNPGTPVLSAAAGTVMYAGSGLRGYGKLVIIRHESDYQTVYAHNQELLVKEGDTVVQGQQVAELGSTDADRPVLHFEIRRLGQPLDPMQYLPTR